MPSTDRDVREQVARVDALLERLETLPDQNARDAALGAIQGLIDLYGEGLSRVVEHISATCDDAGAERVAHAFRNDELLAHLLLLHGLHPDATRTRVERALADVRPYLRSHGGGVELLDIDGGTAYVKFEGSCHGCPSSAVTLRTAVENAIRGAAPELTSIQSGDGRERVTDVSALVPLRRRGRTGQDMPGSISAIGAA